jgi:hypothetical protein
MRTYGIFTIVALAIVIIAVGVGCGRESEIDTKIRRSIKNQMSNYPKSTLRDIYKNHFHDNYGPGHIISDKAAADRYLRYELETSKSFEGVDYEPTGYEGRFYRVNLGVIADGRVPYDKFFDAFVRSVNGIEPISIETWHREWREIEAVIMGMKLDMENVAEDSAEIEALIDSGNYVMHHSKRFNDYYQPHYRIIERNIFETEILPLLNQ